MGIGTFFLKKNSWDFGLAAWIDGYEFSKEEKRVGVDASATIFATLLLAACHVCNYN